MSAQNSRPRGVFTALIGLVGFSVLAGVLVTVMVTPALAVTSVAARTTIDVFDDLPEFLAVGATPQQNTIWAMSGGKPKQIATVFSQNRQEIDWDQVSPVLKSAVLAAEDRRFYEHGGIDLQGIARAAVKNLAGGNLQGASTLTQQLVKNVCITKAVTANDDPSKESEAKRNKAIDACQESSFDRKIKEMKQAIGLEKQLTKDQILLGYLNIAGFGGNVYGIESAAEQYYKTDAKDLTIAQAASLVGIVQEPGLRRLDIPANYEANKARRDIIINNMFNYGMISAADRDTALATPVDASTVTIAEPSNGCIAADSSARQFCDYVVRSVKDLEPLGASEKERLANWKIGGYKIYTSLDLKLNKVAQTTLRDYAPVKETAFQLGASAVSIQPGTGYIITMAQNKVFDNQGEESGGGRAGTSAINFNTDKEYGGSSGFQPGSGYKLFTLLNWLESGHGLNEVVNVSRVSTPQTDFTNSCGPLGGTPYSPKNDSGETGYRTVREATANSINGGYVQMALALDLCKTKEIALSLGVHRAAPFEKDETLTNLSTGPASILGVDEIAPMTLAAAYAAVAAGGTFCKPIFVTDVTNAAGDDLGPQKSECTPGAIDSEIAAAAADGLSTGGGRYASNPHDGTAFIGKTGTTNSSKDTWVTMSSTALTTTVWFGNINGDYPIRQYCGGLAGCDGGQQRHAIMRKILTAADKTYPGGVFPTAPTRLINGVNVKVGDYVGMDEATAKSAITGLKLQYSNAGEIASPLPAGQIAKQSPEAGQSLSEGQKVKIYISDGTKSVVPDVTSTPQQYDAAAAAVTAAGFASVAQACVVSGLQQIDPATGAAVDPTLPVDGQVVSITPSTGTTLLKTKTVTLGIARASC